MGFDSYRRGVRHGYEWAEALDSSIACSVSTCAVGYE